MPRNACLCIAVVLVLTFLPVLATTKGHELSISELENLQFQGGFQPDTAEGSIHDALRTNATLFGAYGLGIESLRTFQEPILTRGAIGVALFRSASPAVVLVAVGRVANDEFQPEGIGSGAIVDPRGYILTNWHVISGYPGALIFMKPELGANVGKSRTYVARVVAQDAAKDLALLKMVNPPSGLPVLRIGNVSAVQLGRIFM